MVRSFPGVGLAGFQRWQLERLDPVLFVPVPLHSFIDIQCQQAVAGRSRPCAYIRREAHIGGCNCDHIALIHFFNLFIQLQNRSGALQSTGIQLVISFERGLKALLASFWHDGFHLFHDLFSFLGEIESLETSADVHGIKTVLAKDAQGKIGALTSTANYSKPFIFGQFAKRERNFDRGMLIAPGKAETVSSPDNERPISPTRSDQACQFDPNGSHPHRRAARCQPENQPRSLGRAPSQTEGRS